MRITRKLLVFAIIATGAAIARPGDVVPVVTKVAELLRASSAQAQEPAHTSTVDGAGHDLPSFVPTSHDLRIRDDSEPDGGGAAAAGTSAQQIKPLISGETTSTTAVTPVAPDAKMAAAPAPAPAVRPAVTPSTPASLRTLEASLPHPVDTSLDANGKPQKLAKAEAPAVGGDGQPVIAAKTFFGAVKGPSLLQARSIGSYSRGCLAGGKALPVDGPAWQAMRLSRNRNWGHPRLIDMIEEFATDAQKKDGWSGLLVGDMSQPRGGPMLTGHASHQIGLDADIWLTPMPSRTLSRSERENIAATSMLDKTDLAVDPKVFTDKHVALIKRAASYPEVERVLVHPAIKKALCQAAGTDRAWLGKVRPIQGHYYHFHVRVSCPPGSIGCVPQKPVTGEDGCGKEVDDWLARMARAKLPAPPKPPGWKPPPRSPPPLPVTMSQLPTDCRMVVESGEDGVNVPAAAMLPPQPLKPVAKPGHKKEPLIKATITLRPAKERRDVPAPAAVAPTAAKAVTSAPAPRASYAPSSSYAPSAPAPTADPSDAPDAAAGDPNAAPE